MTLRNIDESFSQGLSIGKALFAFATLALCVSADAAPVLLKFNEIMGCGVVEQVRPTKQAPLYTTEYQRRYDGKANGFNGIQVAVGLGANIVTTLAAGFISGEMRDLLKAP